ncbi:MAG: Lipopolysaccharide export system ATP-binding protein LptB [Syntrophorhabdus sp. PtaU1.Bin002]|nr:MAG: Lipopolysaccharide export system ATP-binding protein LptB [Syntrophorhabdus sp. PtaB.Bin006]OPY73768.1 MAG: Lipopolysaccharide export system ATP-binding protein LptB [Syntrophorhabdus sp. PtaU1.Bin002]
MTGVTKLSAENLLKSYNARKVVDNISMNVGVGEIVGLFGPNGAGKTTTFYMIIGFIRPNGGRILLDTEDITTLPMFLRARKGITYLPQEPSIFKKMTVEDNLKSILEFQGVKKEMIDHKVLELLESFKLEHLSENNADSLSGGERRRLEIARALMTAPRFMLLDEPFSGIDPISVSDLKKIIFGLKKKGMGILLSDHNVRDSLPICDRAYVVNNGQVLLEGSPETVANDKIVREVYLGEEFYIDVGA